MTVKTVAYGRCSSVGGCGHSACAARTVKYMANSAAKNMSSLDSHTIVPTLTMFGRVSECTLPGWNAAVVTGVIMAPGKTDARAGVGLPARSVVAGRWHPEGRWHVGRAEPGRSP